MEVDLQKLKDRVVTRLYRAIDRYRKGSSKDWRSKICNTVAELFDEEIKKDVKSKSSRESISISKIDKKGAKKPVAMASTENDSKKADELRESLGTGNIKTDKDLVRINVR